MKYYVGTQEDTFRDNSSKASSNFTPAFYGSTGTLLFIYEDNYNLVGVIDVALPIEKFRQIGTLQALARLTNEVRQEINKIKLP